MHSVIYFCVRVFYISMKQFIQQCREAFLYTFVRLWLPTTFQYLSLLNLTKTQPTGISSQLAPFYAYFKADPIQKKIYSSFNSYLFSYILKLLIQKQTTTLALIVLIRSPNIYFSYYNLQMQETKINLKHYVSVVSYLAFKCAQIVKDCAENPNLKKYDKGVDDPVTDADYKIQTFIIKGLNHFFPKLRIVGEETTQYQGQIQLNFQQVTFDNFPKNSHIQQSVPISELCVWIDPIDNTKGFIEDRLQGVTILIGLTRNMKAYLGIVTTPYTVQQNHRIFRPRVNIGNVSSHEAYVSYQLGKWTQIERPPVNKPLRFVTSDRRKNQAIELISKKNEAILSKMGGSGNKLNMVIFGQADVALYLGQGNCRWDSCANEAIVLSLGGCFSNQNGQDMVYDPNAKSFGNKEGNVCLFDKQLHKSIIEDIAAFHGKKV